MTGKFISTQIQIISSWYDKQLHLVKWTPSSKALLKQAYTRLLDLLHKRISRYCMHIKGRGGVKGAIRCIHSQLDKYKFAARLDIKSYYSSINHEVLIKVLRDFELEASLLDIVLQYIKVPDKYNKGRGIVAGGALSPFLGAVYLSPLDYAMEKLCKKKMIFYIRYQDDVIILAKSRWDLRSSLKMLYSVLEDLKLKVHTEEKRFIGKIDKGFSFLGYFFKPNCKLRPSRVCLQRLVSKSLLLYEQKATRKQLLEYLERWLIYFRGGLRGIVQIKGIKKIEKFIDYNFKICYTIPL